MSLPINIILDTHKALSDWKFTVEEAEAIIAETWSTVMRSIVFTSVMAIFGIIAKKI